MANQPRLPPLPREKWDAEVEAAMRAGMPDSVVDRFMSTGDDAMRVPNGISSLMYHPRLAGKFLAHNAVLLFEPVLEHRHRELMVLRVAYRTRSPYEWVQHVKLSGRYGVTAAEVDAVIVGHTAESWTPLEADLLAATDQLLDHYRVADDVWERLAAEFDETALVELLYVVGTYAALAMVFNGIGVQLDPDLDPSIAPPLPSDEESTA